MEWDGVIRKDLFRLIWEEALVILRDDSVALSIKDQHAQHGRRQRIVRHLFHGRYPRGIQASAQATMGLAARTRCRQFISGNTTLERVTN